MAEAGWSVCLIEKKQFPREKTCGDGLTPRSVYQLQQMGLEDTIAAHGHKLPGTSGLRIRRVARDELARTPDFPGYGYTITRFNLDGLVAERAQEYGATLLNGVEAIGLSRADRE